MAGVQRNIKRKVVKMDEHVNGHTPTQELVEELPSADAPAVAAAPMTQRQKLLNQIDSLTQQYNNAKFNMNEAQNTAKLHENTMLQAQGALMAFQEVLKDFPEE